MPSFRPVTIALLLAFSLVACRPDRDVAKKKYLESGNSFFDHGRYKEAAIQYHNSLKLDPKYGPAHFKLGALYLKVKPPQVGMALGEYRRAVETLKADQAYQEEYKQAVVQLSDLILGYDYKNQQDMQDVEQYCEQILKKDPNSFDGYRLRGDLNAKRAQLELESNPPLAAKLFDAAMENYRKAETIKGDDPGVSLSIAMVLGQEKHYAEAEPYFRKVLDKDKTSLVTYMNFYRLYRVEGKNSEAEQLLKEGAQNNPKSPQYLETLAYHYGSLGRRDDMLNVLQQIKSRGSDFPAASQVVGDFFLRIGDAESALREYREGIIKEPKRKSSYQHSIIDVLMRQGKRAEAAEVNAQILKENPKDPDAKSLAATFMIDRGDVATALAQLQAVVTSSPENAVAHYQLGRAYLASGRQDAQEEAKQQFQKAMSLRPDLILPRLGLAELQVRHGEFEGALATIRDILARDPGNVNAKLIQSQALLGQKRYPESDALLAGMLKSNSASPEVFYQEGVSNLTQGKPKDAESAFMRAYQLNPASAKGLMGVVESDFQLGKADEAMATLQAELKKSPNRLDILFLMGTTAQRSGKYQDALRYFNQVLSGLDKKTTARADMYMQIANTYRLQGDRDSAIANYMKAREILPENEIVLSALGLMLDQAGRKSEARQAYEAALKTNPNDAWVMNNLAFLMADTATDLDVALNYAQKAKGLDPNRPEISDTLGWILLKKSLPDNAIPVLKDLVSRYPAQSTYHYHLAMAYKQKTDNTRAIAELREAMKHSTPGDEQQRIQDMLTQLGAK